MIVGDQKLGTVRYAGETSFAEGYVNVHMWIGVMKCEYIIERTLIQL